MMQKYLLVLAALVPFAANAQRDFINEGAKIYIQKGAVVTISGDFINGNSDSLNGNIKNDGVIEIGGNFENAAGASFGIFDDNTSTDRAVKFVGAGTQAIKGDMSNASFYNLVIDKANATDTVELQTPVKVDGSLIFGAATNSTYNPSVGNITNNNKGLLKTYSNAGGEVMLTITNGSRDAIAGFATPAMNSTAGTGYVITKGTRNSNNGGLERNITGTGAYTYPIGTNDHGYNAVKVHISEFPAGGALVKGKFNDGSDNTDGSVGYVGSNGVEGADNDGYNKHFTSNPCNGNSEQWFTLQDGVKDHGYWSFAAANNNNDFKYVIEMFPASFSMEGSDLDAMRTVKYDAGYGDNVSAANTDWSRDIEAVSTPEDLLTYSRNTGSCYTGDGVPGGEYTGFAQYSLKKGNSGNALPVELIYVKADAKDNSSIAVSWATALEINNSGFEVQRSTDGKSFETIGWVAGGNNSTTTLSYSYNDKDVTANTVYYYQLRQVDNDGASELSQIVTASLNGTAATQPTVSISDIMPNPAVDYSRITVSSTVAQDVTVAIYDMTGRIVSNTAQSINAGNSDVTVDVTMLSNGNYTTVIVANGQSFAKNLLVAKN